MKGIKFLLLSLWAIWVTSVSGQIINFREGYQKANPVTLHSDLDLAEKMKLHQDFLAQATQGKDEQKRLYGVLYLFHDYVRGQNFAEAAHYLLEAERIAAASGNPGWQGWVAHCRGVLSLNLKNYEEAIVPYREAARLCGQARDSLCVAESLEQIGALYGNLDSFEKAHYYYDLTLPLIEKYGNKVNLATTLNNLGNLLSFQDRPAEAAQHYERALAAIREVGGNKYREVIYLGNLADAFRQLRRFDTALAMLDECTHINLENNWLHNQISIYGSISETYAGAGNFRSSLEFLKRYHALRDSVIGIEAQEKISDLEHKYVVQQKELELQKSRLALGVARHRLVYGILFVCFLLLLAAAGLWRWRWQTRRSQHELAQNRLVLNDLTRILVDKNTQMAVLQERAAGQSPIAEASQSPADLEQNLYDQRILTDADWAAFKIYFEKVYPGYLLRLRNTFPALSGAEERLFLFIKLNLTTREAAAILGISVESVKKTRNRLRHRLALGEGTDLEMFIRDF
jgi:tetratricopeptide (TPR) repeat protein/DNA-directed RNA polymerase specialized sigma24 family protein